MGQIKKSMNFFFLLLVIFNMTANFAHPVTPTLIKELNLGSYMFGFAFGTMMLCQFLFSPFWGNLNTYISSKKTIFICCIGYGIGQMAFGLATTEATILIARLFSGTFAGGAFVSFLTYTVNISDEKNRAKNLMISATIQSVASAFGYMIGGFLGEISIQWTFFIQAITLVITGFLFMIALKDDRQLKSEIPFKRIFKEANPLISFKSCTKFMTVSFACLFVVSILGHLGYTAFEQCFNYYLKDQYMLSSSYNGIIKAGIGFAALLFNSTICLYLIKKKNLIKSSIYIILASSIVMLFVVVTNELPLFIGLNMLYFALYAIELPIIQDIVAKRAENNHSNLVMGFYNASKSLGAIIGSFSAGIIYSIHVKMPFILGIIATIIALIAGVIYWQRVKKKL